MSINFRKVDIQQKFKKGHFSIAEQRMAKNKFECMENINYKVIEVKAEDQNLAANFYLFSFELLWHNILRGVKKVIE